MIGRAYLASGPLHSQAPTIEGDALLANLVDGHSRILPNSERDVADALRDSGAMLEYNKSCPYWCDVREERLQIC